jgi:hypothetical protein
LKKIHGFDAFDLWRAAHEPEQIRAVKAGEIGWGDAVEEAFLCRLAI